MKQRTAETAIAWLFAVAALICLLLIVDEANATNTPKTTQSQGQDQAQDQSQDQSQDQAQAQSMGDQQNNQAVTFQTPDNITVKRTVGAYAPGIDPSHPCALTISGGFGLTGGGASFGKAYVDKACNVREWARLMYQMGNRDAAIFVMCLQPEGEEVPDCAGVRDYNKELKLLELGHETLIEENEALREKLRATEELKNREQEICEESKDRIVASCRK